MTLRFNEGRACDGVLRFLEARAGAQRQAVCFPERERHEHPVELVCQIKGQLYALEHTGIEPFTGHVQVNAEAKRRIQPLVERVAGRLPQTEEFELQVPGGRYSRSARQAFGRCSRHVERPAAWIDYARHCRINAPSSRAGSTATVRRAFSFSNKTIFS